MLIVIDDELPSIERKKLLDILPIVYALRKHRGCIRSTANFLGINSETLHKNLEQYEELKVFLRPETIKWIVEKEENDRNECKQIKKIFRYHLRKTERSFSFRQKSLEDQEVIRMRIRALYGMK